MSHDQQVYIISPANTSNKLNLAVLLPANFQSQSGIQKQIICTLYLATKQLQACFCMIQTNHDGSSHESGRTGHLHATASSVTSSVKRSSGLGTGWNGGSVGSCVRANRFGQPMMKRSE